MEMRIAIVEDNASLALAIQLLLQKKGHQAVAYGTADALLEALTDGSIDLFVLDINLPDINGLELVEHLRRYCSSSAFLIISSYTDLTRITRAFALGCEDYLKKPFEIEELLLRITRIESSRILAQHVHLSENCLYDRGGKTVWIDGRCEVLSKKESDLIDTLLRYRGRAVSCEILGESVWGREVPCNTISATMRRLRSKIGEKTIVNMRDVGYMIRL